MIQLLDEGGTIWQGDDAYATLDDAFRAADHAAAEWWQDVMGNA